MWTSLSLHKITSLFDFTMIHHANRHSNMNSQIGNFAKLVSPLTKRVLNNVFKVVHLERNLGVEHSLDNPFKFNDD